MIKVFNLIIRKLKLPSKNSSDIKYVDWYYQSQSLQSY